MAAGAWLVAAVCEEGTRTGWRHEWGDDVGMEDWKVLIGERLLKKSRVESECMHRFPPLIF
jgi:hypothetical protein